MTDDPVFQGFVLLLAATYAILLYRCPDDVRLLLRRISRDRTSGERISEDAGGGSLARFLNITAVIGLLFIGVVTVKYGDSLLPRTLLEALPRSAAPSLGLLASTVFAAVACYQFIVLRSSGTVLLARPFTAQLWLLKRTYFALTVIITSPPLLLFALGPRGSGGVWFCIIVLAFTATSLLYLRESLNLFLSKKVSILHWFLYLCTVEIFPLSLLWLLAGR